MATAIEPRSKVYTFKLLTRQLNDMKAIYERDGTSVAEQIRRGVDLWLKQQEMSK